jgi:hypothetical protein
MPIYKPAFPTITSERGQMNIPKHLYMPRRFWTSGRLLSLEDMSLDTVLRFCSKAKDIKEGAPIEVVVDEVGEEIVAETVALGLAVSPIMLLATMLTLMFMLPTTR